MIDTNSPIDQASLQKELNELKIELLSSFLFFTRFFFKLRTGRDFIISKPTARESHHIILAKAFTKVALLQSSRLFINICPGSNKSEMCRHFVAWTLARYPDSKYLYVSFSESRSLENTAIIKEIIELPIYKKLFGIEIDREFSSKSNFKTTTGGQVVAFGSGGSITGGDAGLPGVDRFSGCLLIDDPHKPDEAKTDTTRQAVINNFKATLQFRPRSHKVPIIAIGQRTNEGDLFDYFKDEDTHKWEAVIIPSLDAAGNEMYPETFPKEYLLKLKQSSPYDFSAQHQQKPLPAEGGLFKREWFIIKDKDPDILATFITIDTAETEKSWNDATVFSFWGLYKIKTFGEESEMFGLHWLNCVEIRVEPADLEKEFVSFLTSCFRYKIKPEIVGIEKKSTGVTLCSNAQRMQGIRVIDIQRTAASGSKIRRFINCQPFVSTGRISLSAYSSFADNVITHMTNITANGAHKHDDIADTVADAIQLGLIDQVITKFTHAVSREEQNKVAERLMQRSERLRSIRYS